MIQSTIPVLASLNIKETVEFYEQKLGFRFGYADENYAICKRDDCEIHFWFCDDKHIAENTSCYVRADNLEALHDEFTKNGLQTEPPVLREWGMKELYVIDSHGNLLKFGAEASI
ncbi:MAG: VOC family protein [Acidobacteriota bacterium]|nr:VOC family protein [Acidobacteriota bacterium]